MCEIDEPSGVAPDEVAGPENILPAQPPFDVRSIFVGRDGIRAGWSLAVFLTLFIALLYCSGAAIHKVKAMVHHSRDTTSQSRSGSSGQPGMSAGYVAGNESVPLGCVVLATWLMSKVERRRFSAYGYDRQRGLRNFFAGLAWGVALLSLLIGLLRACGLLVFDARLLSGATILRFGAIWLGGFGLVALLEESINRGYLQFTLSRGLSGIWRWLFGEAHANAGGFWISAVILSFVFGFGHLTNPGESPLGLLSAGAAGLLFCLSLWRTGSLWWAIGFHTSWDWAQSFLYGVADSGLMVSGHLYATHPVGRPILSGGLTGPEGSILLLPVMAAAVAVVLLTLPRTNLGYTPARASQAALD